MPTVLRVSGPHDKLRHAILATPFAFQESIATKNARERGDDRHAGSATFNLTVSDADGDEVTAQLEETARFLSDRTVALQALRALEGVERMVVDVSWDVPATSAGQYSRFPHALLGLCGALAIDLEVSVYLVDG
jgi:hypothetical protein